MTLEEIDFLFAKDGETGLKKFGHRSQPVQESLRPIEEIEKDAEAVLSPSAGRTDRTSGEA